MDVRLFRASLGDLQAYRHENFKRVIIVRHPLWKDNHPVYMSARSEAEVLFRGDKIVPVNPFEVIRHPAGVLSSGE